MAKASILHVVCFGVVASLTLQRAPKPEIELPAYQGQAIEREVPEESLETYIQGKFTTLPQDLDGAPDLPKSVLGRNLIFAGDHVDRDAVKHICKRYDAQMTSFSDLRATESVAGRKFAHAPAKGSSDNHLLCHLNSEWNVSIMYLWHPGVLSTPPHSGWHQKELRNKNTWKSHLYTADVNGKKIWIDQSQDLAKIYWRKAIYDHLPNRPSIVVTQSSIWDSLLAIGFLDDLEPPRELLVRQEGLEKHGWRHGVEGVGAWNWTEHATTYMNAVKHGLSPEQIVWRTNANCPDWHTTRESDFVRLVSEEQAEIVKVQVQVADQIATKVKSPPKKKKWGRWRKNREEEEEEEEDDSDVPVNPWQGVKIMDWREVYDSASNDGCDGHSGTSFQQKGYESYMSTLWYTLNNQGHGIDL